MSIACPLNPLIFAMKNKFFEHRKLLNVTKCISEVLFNLGSLAGFIFVPPLFVLWRPDSYLGSFFKHFIVVLGKDLSVLVLGVTSVFFWFICFRLKSISIKSSESIAREDVRA